MYNFQSRIEYLDHMIYPSCLRVLKTKVDAIVKIARSTIGSQLGAVLGLAYYYK
jgi:hypothetical protein